MRNVIIKTRETKEAVEVEIISVSDILLTSILKNNQFDFDWQKEKIYDLYALKIIDSNETVGLMALKDVRKELRIEIVLIELSIENQGSIKVYDNIAGCLIAFACELSYLYRYDGFVTLVPKTLLIDHYKNSYGFIEIGNQLAVFKEISSSIMEKFLFKKR